MPGHPADTVPDRKDHEDRDDSTVLTFRTDAGLVRIGRIIDSSLGLRQQLWNEKVAVNLMLNDPLDLYRNSFVTSDTAHVQTGRTRWSYRMATLSVSYNFGRAPRSERKVQTSDSPRLQEVDVDIR